MSESFVDVSGRNRVRKTHCKHGHEFTDASPWAMNWKGYSCRVCLVCQAGRMRRKRANPDFKANEAAKMRQWRKDNPERYRLQYQAEFDKRRGILLDARKGGCVSCGETDVACLDFHHRDPETKEGHIGEFRKFGMKRLLTEIAKCDVLCANCHRKHHRDERQNKE